MLWKLSTVRDFILTAGNVRPNSGGMNLRCFPADDRAFCRRVEVLAKEADLMSSPAAAGRLEAILRERYYPAATVFRRESLADDEFNPEPTWYVFRDGSVVPQTARPGRILVVDDDAIFVDMVRAVLVEAGFVVESAPDGRQALDVAAVFVPDVILLDLAMPRSSGEEFARLYELEPEPKARIVVVSGRPEAPERAMAIGARAVIPKPFEVVPFIELLQRYA
jgi:CheY-like chemotaxis protein